jgi:hypothetical protein
MATEPRKAQYFEFINTLLPLRKDLLLPNDVVWHYTTGESLLKIIESGMLFSTQVACLNDSSEIRYSAGQLRKVLVNLDKTRLGERVTAFLDKYMMWLQALTPCPGTQDFLQSSVASLRRRMI